MIRFLFSLLIVAIVSSPSYPAITADFIKEKNSNIPKGWELKEWKGKGEILIENEGGISFIRLKSSKNSFALHKELNFNIKEYPVITWRWKVSRLPDGADARNKKADDQAAQLYIVFPKFPAMINSRLIGYIWETSAPEGTIITSRKNLNTKYIVVQSGKEKLGGWIEEKRNVYADYKKLFNEEPLAVGKISIMIDSDDTKSSAESFFSAIRFEKEPVMIAEAPKSAAKATGAQILETNLAMMESIKPSEGGIDAQNTGRTGKNEKEEKKNSKLAAIKAKIIPSTALSLKFSEFITKNNIKLYMLITTFILASTAIIIVLVFKRNKDNIKK